MRLRDILRAKGGQVHTIRPDQTVRDAVAALVEHRIGALLVVDPRGTPVGIISERDVLRECLHGAQRLHQTRVGGVMTKDLLVGLPDDEVGRAMGIMTQNRVRHLPVLEEGRVVGMISIGDVVKATLEETVYENRYLREYIQAR